MFESLKRENPYENNTSAVHSGELVKANGCSIRSGRTRMREISERRFSWTDSYLKRIFFSVRLDLMSAEERGLRDGKTLAQYPRGNAPTRT